MQTRKDERLQELFRRLMDAAPAATAEAALELIATTLNAVEDDLHPGGPGTVDDGRPHVSTAARRSRAHNTFIRINGAIEIRDLADQVPFSTAGADGNYVWKP